MSNIIACGCSWNIEIKNLKKILKQDTIENINFLTCKKCNFQTTLKSSMDRHKCKSSEVDKRRILELENKNILREKL